MTAVPRGVVSVSHPLAAEAGASILRSGGNAVDAAAAVQFALNVVEPLASGLGGGAFSLIRLANGETTIVDSRERAPASARADQFLGPDRQPLPIDDRHATARSVGVPGTLLGQAVAVQRWGTLSLAAVLRPAIELAEQEVPVSTLLASRLADADIQERVRADPFTRETYLPAGRPLKVGDSLRQPDLARTFHLIADRGPDAFYRGAIARAIVDVVNDRGGALTTDDLATYSVELRRPLLGAFRGYQVATMPPPGSGLTLLEILGLVEHLNLSSLDPLGALRLHLELQAIRLALVDRAAVLGDPAYTHVPIDALLDRSSLAERRQLISPGPLEPAAPVPGPAAQAQSSSAASPGQRECGETTHFVVVDRWGNLVSCTSTIEEFFGSGITVPGFGFLLNDELADFDALPGGPNQVRPGARPASSMVPTLLLRDGLPYLTLGSPGGPTIVSAVFQVLCRVVEDGWELARAVSAPRVFPSRYPRFTWEEEIPAEVRTALSSLCHRPASQPRSIGAVQAVYFDQHGQPIGFADPRRDGAVIEVG